MSAAAPANAIGAQPPPAKVKLKLLILFVAASLLMLATGGSVVFVMKQRAAAAAEADDEGSAASPRGVPVTSVRRAVPTFLPLETFVVNLADKDTERYAQIGLTLEVDDPRFAEDMKLYMPAIRNAILMILAHKSSQELLGRAGKEALAAEIMREAVRPMGIEIEPDAAAAGGDANARSAKAARPLRPALHNPVRRVHFASFIVQ